MSSELPRLPARRPEHDLSHLPTDPFGVMWAPRPPVRKFRHNYRTHVLLFLLTFLTTTWLLAFDWMWFTIGTDRGPFALFTWQTFVGGLWYSVPLLSILTAHEFGHYLACRYYNVDASLPYYLPAPIGLAGTFGAVIRIREAFPSKRALFDIGVAGPLAGFAALLPCLLVGLKLSQVGPSPPGSLYFAEPLMWKILERVYFGVIPEGFDVMLHPLAMAAWWGTLVTAINLLPFGQLDGGHLAYAVVGRWAARLSAATLGVVVLLTLQSISWWLMALIMVGASLAFGFGHPQVIDERPPLGASRHLLAALALVIFILCFMPVPITQY